MLALQCMVIQSKSLLQPVMNEPQFLCTGYVSDAPQGPLSITAIENDNLLLVGILYGTEKVRQQLASGVALDDVVASMKAIQHTENCFPIAQLNQIDWNEYSSDVVFTYETENKHKRASTSIASNEDRTRLLKTIEGCVAGPVKYSDELASILAVAWSRITGAVMALVGTIALYVLWDPVRLGRIRGGHLALALGRNGCAVVGAGIFVACCISGWLAIRKRYRCYTCVIGDADDGSVRQK